MRIKGFRVFKKQEKGRVGFRREPLIYAGFRAYADHDRQALKAITSALADVEKVLDIILSAAEKSNEEAA